MRMRTTIVRHVEALRKAGWESMWWLLALGMLLLRRDERLLRGHDGEIGHSAAGRKWVEARTEYATQGERSDGVIGYGMVQAM